MHSHDAGIPAGSAPSMFASTELFTFFLRFHTWNLNIPAALRLLFVHLQSKLLFWNIWHKSAANTVWDYWLQKSVVQLQSTAHVWVITPCMAYTETKRGTCTRTSPWNCRAAHLLRSGQLGGTRISTRSLRYRRHVPRHASACNLRAGFSLLLGVIQWNMSFRRLKIHVLQKALDAMYTADQTLWSRLAHFHESAQLQRRQSQKADDVFAFDRKRMTCSPLTRHETFMARMHEQKYTA